MRRITNMHRWLSVLICGSVSLFFSLAVCPFAGAAENSDLMRILAPVRLPSEPGPQLDQDVQKTRELLERFQKGGFEYAVWAVDSLPKKQKDMKDWVDACLKAFPGKVILALDSKIEGGAAAPATGEWKPFLKQVLPQVDSVLINYSHLNNCECSNNAPQAIEAVRGTVELVRGLASGKFLWLLVHDCPESGSRAPDWTAPLAPLADGYFVYRIHSWNMTSPGAVEQLLKTGKPVVRAGFQYACPTVRPGLEKDIEGKYLQRMAVYEKWISENGQKGYCRELGKSIPCAVNPNEEYSVIQ